MNVAELRKQLRACHHARAQLLKQRRPGDWERLTERINQLEQEIAKRDQSKRYFA